MFDKSNCTRNMYDTSVQDNIGCIGILKPEALKEIYRKKEYQVFRICGGFGAYPDKMGNAVYGTFCFDGEECRMERYNFIGIANSDVVTYAERFEKERSNA